MANWSDWTNDVAPDVRGCPTPLIEKAVKRTVIDFLQRTAWLQRTAEPIDIPGAAGPQTFASPVVEAGEVVLRIVKAWISGAEVDLYAPSDVDDTWPDWKSVTGTPECVVQEKDDAYYVVPAPTALMPAALRLRVAVGLLESATSCDDTILQTWRLGIAAGAKAQLQIMPEKPWSAPDRAQVFAGQYEDAVRAALLRSIRSPARRTMATRPNFF